MLGDINDIKACIVTYKGKRYFAIKRCEMFYIRDEEHFLTIKEIFLADTEEHFLCKYNHHHEAVMSLIFSELESAIDKGLKRRQQKE